MAQDPGLSRRNGLVAGGLVVFVAGMAGLSFAAVPLYRLFCQVTGYGGTPQLGGGAPEGAAADARSITVRFNANTSPELPWQFHPLQPSVTLKLGDEAIAFYAARNEAGQPVSGVSTYNVTPERAGKYFHKTACFCFTEQTLAPGQDVQMPVAFWVDPAIAQDPYVRDVTTITLSYTFFRSLDDAARAGALASAGPHVGPLPGTGGRTQ